MLRLVLIRVLQTIPVLLAIIALSFGMLKLVPGGPFDTEKAVPPEIKRNLEAYYGLDLPAHRQFLRYLANLARGDLGYSMRYSSRTVNEIIADKLPVSLHLGGLALAVALALGLSAGILAAVFKNTALDYSASALAMIGICVPTFVLGPVAVLLFAIHLRWFNASGWYEPLDWVLPSLVLGMVYAAYIARLTRGGMLEVLSQDYIRTARAKGASGPRVILRHALHGGLIPVISYLGPAIAGILTGSFVIETIFQIPGLGRAFVESALNRDQTLVLGTVILYAVLLITLNLLVDILQTWLNPRSRSR
ncbi:MAG: ABC transporter permease subunit [Opitutaceae bacterium]|nr:ABC transporter permease subunit [Opitutaceae bacterium]